MEFLTDWSMCKNLSAGLEVIVGKVILVCFHLRAGTMPYSLKCQSKKAVILVWNYLPLCDKAKNCGL